MDKERLMELAGMAEGYADSVARGTGDKFGKDIVEYAKGATRYPNDKRKVNEIIQAAMSDIHDAIERMGFEAENPYDKDTEDPYVDWN